MNEDTAESLTAQNRGYFTHTLQPRKTQSIGGYTILPLEVHHDVPCFAFVISHCELKDRRILFATDCISLPYTAPNISLMMIECNYTDTALTTAIEQGETDPHQRQRLEGSHMELTQTIEAIKRQQKRSGQHLQATILLHTSQRNADPQEMTDKVERATSIPTYIATRGLEYTL